MSFRDAMIFTGVVVGVVALAVALVALNRTREQKADAPRTVERELGPENENGPGACGRERWAVKTLTDLEAKAISWNTITTTTVAALASLPVPESLQHGDTRAPEEREFVSVQAQVLGAKLEADSDIHLAVSDVGGGATMIAEFPALACTHGAQHRYQMERARRAYIKAYGLPSKSRINKSITGCVWLAGVIFYDRIHGQFGVARNGIELHPVTYFHKGDC